jgi:dephospho-CoA kinase
MLRVGLTGGIGSGKSAVLAMFADQGVPVINLDAIAREVVAPGSAALEAIIEHFGRQVLGPDGTLDRQRLRERVVASDQERKWLEALLHPLIRERRRQLENAAAEQASYLILEIPLLVENLEHQDLDRILVVDVPESIQRRRALDRGGMTEDEISHLMAVQASRDERLAAANDIIDNSGDRRQTRAQVERLHRQYLMLSRGAAD